MTSAKDILAGYLHKVGEAINEELNHHYEPLVGKQNNYFPKSARDRTGTKLTQRSQASLPVKLSILQHLTTCEIFGDNNILISASLG